MLSARLVVVLSLVGCVAASWAGCGDAPSTPPPDVCEELRTCFFNDPKGSVLLEIGDPERYENLVAGTPEINAAYGAGGSCYESEDRASVCEDQCLCTLRQLCHDVDVREAMCARDSALTRAGACCDHEALRAYEASDFDRIRLQQDGRILDARCQLPAEATVPPLSDEAFCASGA